LVLALGIALLVLLAAIALMPVALVQRYRMGTVRRPARGWLTTLNLVGVVLSSAIFIAGAAVTNVWVPDAFLYSLIGLTAGGLLGLLGLGLTKWEVTPRALHYTPNRWLVLAITLIVTARLIYGFWRSWRNWQLAPGTSWIVTSGVAGSLGAGAVVLGYYLTYWIGVRRRVARHQQTLAAGDAVSRARRVPGRRM
jgi:hypothetical protein